MSHDIKWYDSLDSLMPLLTQHDPEVVRRLLSAMGGAGPVAAAGWDEHRRRDGESFVFDEPDQIPAVWGEGERVLWPEGEAVMLVGHQGVGKTTIAQQVVLHRIGIRSGAFLGLPLVDDGKPILYLAMDRPRQAARSLRRMVAEKDRDLLRERLVVWRGPLPINPLDKSALADFVQEVCPGVGSVVVDSVKDLAPGISDDKIGAGLNAAWQEIIARDIELMVLHHERKAGGDSKRLHRLDDVYGSTWLTSGLGSVVVINGEPGDPTVELTHLKQPAEPVGPLTVRHEHSTGTSTLLDGTVDLMSLLIEAGDDGITARDLAQAIVGRCSDGDLKKVQRQLAKLDTQRLAQKIPGAMGSDGRSPDRWAATPQTKYAHAQ